MTSITLSVPTVTSWWIVLLDGWFHIPHDLICTLSLALRYKCEALYFGSCFDTSLKETLPVAVGNACQQTTESVFSEVSRVKLCTV